MIIIPDVNRPEILIQFRVDIGNGSVGAENNYVRVVQNGITDLYRWEVSEAGTGGFLDAVDENGTIGSLIVQAGGVMVIDVDNPPPEGMESFLLVVDISTQQSVAAPSVPGQVIQPGPSAQPEDGLVFV